MDFTTKVSPDKKVECLKIYLKNRRDFAWSLNGFAKFAAQHFNVSVQDILDDHNMLEVFVGRSKKTPKTNINSSTAPAPAPTSTQARNTSTKANGKGVEDSYKGRPGQAKFRRDALALYRNCCIVTGTTGGEAVDAAHIHPYAELGGHELDNGLVLRKDIHSLFDHNKIGLRPDGDGILVELSSEADKNTYDEFTKDKITFDGIEPKPRLEALKKRYEQFREKNGL